MFIRNAWYVAAWSHELGEALLARTICDEDVVLYRTAEGAPIALEDRCCHRHLPLSMGRREGNGLRCGYHGLLFDAEGRCIEIPGQAEIPPGAKVATWPLVERWGFVWIWVGERAKADPALVPNLWWADTPGWKFSPAKMVPLACDYRLIADNVMDVTHLTYVHASSIGTGSLTEVTPDIELSEEVVRVSRWVLDRPPPPMYGKAGGFEAHADRWAMLEWRAPNVSVNFAGCVDVGYGGPGKDLSLSPRRVELVAISVPTPVTAGKCSYFFGFSRAFGLDDPAMDFAFEQTMPEVFREDFVVLEAQQAKMAKYPDAPQISLRNDRASVYARRLLERRAEAEVAKSIG